MGTSTDGLEMARKHLEVYEDWKADHDAAMRCYRFEDWMAQGVRVLGFPDAVHARTRNLVYRGVIPNDPEHSERIQDLYRRWLTRAETGLAELETLSVRYGEVAGAEPFQKAIDRVRGLLANWQPLVRSETLAGQHWEVTAEEEPELTAVLAAKRGEPGALKRTPRPVPAGDASLIR